MRDTVNALPAHVLLREETREAHEDTEASGGMRRLMDGALDEAGYEALLRAQLGLFEGWEAERAGWLAGDVVEAGWAYVSRAGLLCGDLGVASGAGSYRGPGSANGTATAPPVGASSAGDPTRLTPTYWGELYVIEGSALGGRIIARRLRELYPTREHRFYAIGEESPSAWRRFQHILDTRLHDDASRRAAVDGARRMFARFKQTLKDPAAHV